MNSPTYFAAATEPSQDLFGALGIEWQLLIIQIVAFLILVWLLGKFVYPWLMKSVDERHKTIEDAARAAKRAQDAAAESQEETAGLLAQARKEAAEIVSTAKLEAAEIASASEAKAKSTAEQIVADAHDRIQKDIDKAKRDLHNEALALIAETTEKVVRGTHDKKADEALIAQLLKESK